MIPMLVYVLGAFLLFGFASMFYVYRLRGTMRYAGVREYVRKGWPMFTPLNCLLYAGTEPRARKPFMDLAEFPELELLRENWEVMREEGLELQRSGFFDDRKQAGASRYDIGFRTFFKYGWRRFYLKWYGYYHESAMKLCPKTTEILRQAGFVNGAMFSLLTPRSVLTRHLDPAACSLRYHLGLSTPNSDDCFISVDGQTRSWRDGEGIMFDETYLHSVRNDTDDFRLILMCDVERPMNLLGRFVNYFPKIWLKASIVPNMEGDRCGLANKLFLGIAPILARLKNLKKTNRPLYKVVKWAINLVIAVIALGALAGLVSGIWWLVS
ncbi:MAG: beta-hydroxylase [Chlamydiales bacterium]|jgi:beta-hydroxylase